MKLTTKLIFSFLLISALSTGIVMLLTRVTANREFDNFINNRYQEELVEELTWYYQSNQTWKGVEYEFDQFGYGGSNHAPYRDLEFYIVNEDGEVIVAGGGRNTEEMCSAEELASGTPINVNGKTAGILIIEAPLNRSPVDYEFLRRLQIYFLQCGRHIHPRR